VNQQSTNLICPSSGSPLVRVDKKTVMDLLGLELRRADAHRTAVSDSEVTDYLMLRVDHIGAYPVIDDVPILMAPEMLSTKVHTETLDTRRDPYREAYEEMDFYNAVADHARSDVSKSDAFEIVNNARTGGDSFPGRGWLDSDYEITAQSDAYHFLAPMQGVSVAQLGGKGIHAVKFLLAGAAESWLVTPVLGEATLGRDLAAAFGVQERFRAVVGISEEIPVSDRVFDRIYSGGCVHHMITERAFPEIRRVLKPGGKFAAVEPWRAPGYKLGTKILGKRERGVNCRPLEPDRVSPLYTNFEEAAVHQHGTFTRYPLIAMGKAKIRPREETVERLLKWDDRLASRLSMQRFGSSAALLATRTR
jgi:SAM-dependent methyltransferase